MPCARRQTAARLNYLSAARFTTITGCLHACRTDGRADRQTDKWRDMGREEREREGVSVLGMAMPSGNTYSPQGDRLSFLLICIHF